MLEKVNIENFESLISFEDLINQCVISNNVILESLCQEVVLSPNETITLVLSLKERYYSIERYIYICSEDPFSTEYTIYGEGDKVIVPTNLMIPTETMNTEKIFFYQQWVRREKITFVIKNRDQYRGFKIWLKGYIKYINVEFYGIINNLIKSIENQLYKRG